jgi:ATP-dependent RNA helicase RhlB
MGAPPLCFLLRSIAPGIDAWPYDKGLNMPVGLLKKIGRKLLGGHKKKHAGDKPVPKQTSQPRAASAKAGPPHPAPGRKRRRRRKNTGADRAHPRVQKPEPQPEVEWSPEDFKVPPREGETRFHDMDIPDEIMHAIADLEFQYCMPIQAKVLPHAVKGENVAGRAQTGTGKTAAFLISIFSWMLRKPLQGKPPAGTPRALVIAPTRELVIQIAKDAEALARYTPFRCLAVYGGMDYNKQESALRNDRIDLIAATPGRLLDFCNRRVIDLGRAEFLIIDEADRMLDMGFIPDVKRIIRRTPPKDRRRTMLYSATLTEDVLRLASQWMPDPVICEVEPEKVTVDTVTQVVYSVQTRAKFALLYNLITQRDMKRVLVFGNRRDSTERVADRLERRGVNCALLSGAVAQKRRLRILEEFREGKIQVVVATDVAGRGLHIDDIDYVINFDFPYEPEDYVHRIGRTGRAGAEGTAISFACEEESFIIPDIEAYIGMQLQCLQPEEELLARPPRASRPPARRDRDRGGGRSGGRPRSGSRGGPRGGSRGSPRHGGRPRR